MGKLLQCKRGAYNSSQRMAIVPKKKQAFWRYVYGSLWIVPCLVIHAAYPLRGWQIIGVLFVVSLFLWPLTIYIDRKNRQGLPDRIAGTKLVELPRHPNKES